METILKIKNVSKTYTGAYAFKALHPTSLCIKKGTIHVITGRSGSGKSTLLNIMGGMDRPTSGEVEYFGKSLYKMSDKEQSKIRGSEFGYVFQFFQLIDELSVYENICLPLAFTNQIAEKEVVSEIVEELGMSKKMDCYPQELSGGEQQRVALARAIINKPNIIFADEPTANLDKYNAKRVAELLISLCREMKTTLILVTHNEDLIENPDSLYTMENGMLQCIKGG